MDIASVPAHVHADLEEHHGHARVLADGPVALGAQARVDQDLGHGVPGGGGLLPLVGGLHGADEIQGVIDGDELEGVGDGLDEVFLANGGHDGLLTAGEKPPRPRQHLPRWRGRQGGEEQRLNMVASIPSRLSREKSTKLLGFSMARLEIFVRRNNQEGSSVRIDKDRR
jgi:hypothetical protein